jgi:hypothetical protein
MKQQGRDFSSLKNSLIRLSGLIASAKQAKDETSADLNLPQVFDARGIVTDLKLM